MICYAYDYDQYCKMRGLYMDIRKEMPYVQNEDQLISAIKNMNYEDMCEKTIRFREKFIQKYGNSSQRVVDLIHRKIEG
jgi:CDP-glycerol glycerophosphotransferase (TagB/SpsB family)